LITFAVMNAPAVKNYLSLVKFSHTIFALPFAAIGFTLGLIKQDFNVPYSTGLKVLLCMVFARTAAMAFNRWADAAFDALNPRTAVRELPSGVISSGSALFFTIVNCILFIATTWFINPLCFYLSFIALAVVLGYSYTKRFTALCHLILGVGLSLAPIGAYLAVTGKFDLLPLYISFAVLCWVSGFDIIYALQDEQFDKKNELYSIPSVFGGSKALSISTALHTGSSLFLLAAGLQGNFGMIYFTGWILFSLLLIYQHRLVKPNDLSKVNIAFFKTNGIASLLFALFTISDVFVGK
jgi:4-hydroxybenzoate polyprenyltransferase